MTQLFGYFAGFLTNATIYALFAMGLNLQYGFTGLVNFGHVAFMALGAYTAVMLVMHGFPFWLGFVAAIAVPAAFSLFLGFTSLRLRDDYLAIVTIGLAEVIRSLLNGLDITNGPEGFASYPLPFFTWVPYQDWRWLYFAFALVLTALAFVFIEYLVRSPWGRVLKAIREDQEAAVALGKNIVSYKIAAFGIGCAIAGLAGALQAFFFTFINPHTYEAIVTFEAWTIMVLGGAGRNWGVMAGAVLYYGFYSSTALYASGGLGPFSANQVGSLRIAIIGLLLVLLMLYRPQGLFGRKEDLGLER